MNESLIWFDGQPETSFKDFDFIDELDLPSFLNVNRDRRVGEPKHELRGYFSVREDTLSMRQELFAELLQKPALYAELNESFSILREFFEIQTAKDGAPSNEKLLYDIKRLESYVSYVRKMRDIFAGHAVESASLKRLEETVSTLYDVQEYEQLCKIVQERISTITHIKSVTIGVNLDAQLRPIEAGLVAVNDECYVSGDLLNRIFRMQFDDNRTYDCLAPLVPIDRRLSNEELGAVRMSINSAINKIFASSLKHCSSAVKRFSVERLKPLLPLLEEWRFVVSCVTPLAELKKDGFPLCKADFGERDSVTGLYHPILALSAAGRSAIVQNDLLFDETAGIYLLTGPNQGGKSIYTKSVGVLYAMLHLGLPLPAERAVCRPTDAILVHFIDAKKTSYQDGRLSEECKKIDKINQLMTQKSLFLFDEALSSTNATEATAISAEILAAYAEIGARGIWTTHFHELCQLERTSDPARSKLCNIRAQIDEASHRRMFRIVRGDYGQSYAIDVARQYHLTREEILRTACGETADP